MDLVDNVFPEVNKHGKVSSRMRSKKKSKSRRTINRQQDSVITNKNSLRLLITLFRIIMHRQMRDDNRNKSRS